MARQRKSIEHRTIRCEFGCLAGFIKLVRDWPDGNGNIVLIPEYAKAVADAIVCLHEEGLLGRPFERLIGREDRSEECPHGSAAWLEFACPSCGRTVKRAPPSSPEDIGGVIGKGT